MTDLVLEKAIFSDRSTIVHAPDMPFPLQQHPAYALATMALGKIPELWTIRQGSDPVAQMMVQKNRFLGVFGVTAIMRGPRFLAAPSEALETEVYRLILRESRKWRWQPLLLMPELARTSALKKAGATRVMTGYATLWLDLRDDLDAIRARLDGKWRNQLKKAEKADLTVQAGKSAGAGYRWLLEQEAEQQTARGYAALPTGFLSLYRDAGGATLSLVVSEGRDKRAGAVFLIHGKSATYHIGFATDQGRALNAMNVALFEGIKALKAEGVRFLDMGGLNTGPMAGIARFKLGLEKLRLESPLPAHAAESDDRNPWPITLPGTFV